MESLYYRYGPTEVDQNIDIEEKRRIMKEWHDAIKVCLINEKLNVQKCISILNDANLGVRYGYREFLNICKVPYINFS